MFRRPRPAAARALPAVALAALLAACGGDGGGSKVTGPGAKNLGTFSGAVAGGVARSINGIALYGQLTGDAGATALQFGMGSLKADSSFGDLVVITREKRDLPAPGTYAFHNAEADADPAPEAFTIAAFMDQPNDEVLLCVGTEGTLTVQSVSGGHVKGSYTAKANCLGSSDVGHEIAVTLTGTFDAVEATAGSLPNSSRASVARLSAARASTARR